jgi:hypothetical protein
MKGVSYHNTQHQKLSGDTDRTTALHKGHCILTQKILLKDYWPAWTDQPFSLILWPRRIDSKQLREFSSVLLL